MKSTAIRPSQAPETDPKRTLLLEEISEDAPRYVSVFRRAYAGKSLKTAIQAQCLECCWFDRQAIRECSATQCGLWAVRPYQGRRAKR